MPAGTAAGTASSCMYASCTARRAGRADAAVRRRERARCRASRARRPVAREASLNADRPGQPSVNLRQGCSPRHGCCPRLVGPSPGSRAPTRLVERQHLVQRLLERVVLQPLQADHHLHGTAGGRHGGLCTSRPSAGHPEQRALWWPAGPAVEHQLSPLTQAVRPHPAPTLGLGSLWRHVTTTLTGWPGVSTSEAFATQA